MHKIASIIAAVALLLFVRSPLRADQNGDVNALVAQINARGFSDIREVDLSAGNGQYAVSPLMRWYTRFIVAMGTDKAPAIEERNQASALMARFSGKPGRDFANGVWTDDVGTSYSATDASALLDAIRATTVRLHWAPGDNVETPVDGPMAEWIVAHSGADTRNAHGLVQAMNNARYFRDISNHPFNALTALCQRSKFDLPLSNSGDGNVRLPHFRDGGVQGIRLDSTDSSISVYLFYGEGAAIRTLLESLDLTRWNEIASRFTAREATLPTLPLHLLKRAPFDPGAPRSFGTWLDRPNIRSAGEQVVMDLRSDEMTLSAITGIEGQGGDPTGVHVDVGSVISAQFSPSAPLVSVVVDRTTAVILLIGTSIVPQTAQ